MESVADDQCGGEGNQNSITLRYIQPILTLTMKEMNLHRDDNLRILLARKRLHLILDLDHTLIHSIKTKKLTTDEKERIKSISDVHHMYVAGTGTYAVKLRPAVGVFLEQVGSMFDVSIYTLGSRGYAQEVNKLLESKVGFPKAAWVIAREDCIKERQKRLDVVLSHPSVVVIVDDTKEVWGDCCVQNLVHIGRYEYFPIKKGRVEEEEEVDSELGRVLRILKGLHQSFYDCGGLNDVADIGGEKDIRELLKSSTLA